MEGQEVWRICGPCKKPIRFGSLHYVCSVSSCKKQVFCSRDCWSAHVPMMRHKDAWPEESYAPAVADPNEAEARAASELRRRRVVMATSLAADDPAGPSQPEVANDILIVASKLKQYIKGKSQMNTSAQVLDRLSDIVRACCDEAIKRAREDGRKTLLDRDFTF